MNHKLQGFAFKTGGFLQLIFATAFVLGRYIIALRVVNRRLIRLVDGLLWVLLPLSYINWGKVGLRNKSSIDPSEDHDVF